MFRTEQHPPWDDRSEFKKLCSQLDDFYESLPLDMQFDSDNPSVLIGHLHMQNSSYYTALHTLLSMCTICLHREYIPFIPIRCKGPEGPLDQPTFPAEKYAHEIPDGFWEKSAQKLFRAARNIMTIVQLSLEERHLVQTPQVGFALYLAAFVAVYAVHFPQMDVDQDQSFDVLPETSWSTLLSKALTTIGTMKKVLRMATGWFRTLHRMINYYTRIIKDHERNTALVQGSGDTTQRKLSIRQGGHGGGLEEYKLLEKVLQEFGSLVDDAPYFTYLHSVDGISDGSSTRASTLDPDQKSNAPWERGSSTQGTEQQRQQQGWQPINMLADTAHAASQRNNTPVVSRTFACHPDYGTHNHPYFDPSGPRGILSPASTPSQDSPYTRDLAQPGRSNPQTYSSETQPAYQPSVAQHTHPLMGPPPHQYMTPNTPGEMRYPEQQLPNISLGGSDLAGFGQGVDFGAWAGDEGMGTPYVAYGAQTDMMVPLWAMERNGMGTSG